MRLILLIPLAMLAVSEPASANDEAKREACKEEAKRAVGGGRNGRIDRDRVREMRREYARDCRKR
jgi:hypothetical protein